VFQYSFNAALLTNLVIAPAAGDDSVTLDFANGNPLPAATSIDGGAAVDTLRVIGSTGADTAVFDTSSAAFNGAAINLAGIDVKNFDGAGGGDGLTVNGGTVALEATQRLSSLAIDTTDARLDARDHDIILDYSGSSPLGVFDGVKYTGVLGMIATGYNFGALDGNGLATTMPQAQAGLTTLAAADAADLYGLAPADTTLYEGQTIDATTVIIKYTYTGDANLDGVIDGGDYGVIDNFVQVPNAFGYFNGDFNYDGVIDGGDYGIIDNNIQAQGAAL
jgi:hypothetical protein